MPAYGKRLTPAEVDALVAFMQTLRPAKEPGVKPADKSLNKLPRDIARAGPPLANLER